jgi:glycosyltransferase involved in cell wall biosynthesis
MADRLIAQGCEKYKLTTISNWVDSSFIKPLEKEDNTFIKEHNLQDKFIIIYSGNMGSTHDIESLVFVAEKLQSHLDIHFVIIGDGIKRSKIERIIHEKSIRNITLLHLQPSHVLPYSLTSGDLAYITLDEGAESASVPSKLFYMLAAGCGIVSVSSIKSELGALTKFYNFGEVFSPGDIESISEFIIDCKNHPLKMNEYKRNARKASFDFTPENAIQFYKVIVNA